MKVSLESISRALWYGFECKPKKWLDFLKTKTIETFEEYSELISNNRFELKARKFRSLIDFVPFEARIYIHYLICRVYHQGSFVALKRDEDPTSSVRFIKECHFHYEECNRLLQNKIFSSKNSSVCL